MSDPLFPSSNPNFSSFPLPLVEQEKTLLIAPIDLPQLIPKELPAPKFRIGQVVVWATVKTHGFGRIIGLVFSGGISVTAYGYHYLISFASNSLSRMDCVADWAFEDDLQLLETCAHLLQIKPHF